MKKAKIIISAFLCLVLIVVCSFATAAATTPIITLSNVSAMPDEEVTIDIKISNNPGIMAMSFCITYDNTAFEYTGYNKGYLSKYTIKDHADKGQVAFVNDEASDKANDGVMLSIKFKVKDTAAPGKHTITLANQNREKHGNRLHNSFSNSNLKYIVPTVTSGSITVGETCENAGHKYGEWQIITPANCVSTGSKTHSCIRCNNHTETVEIPITHDFETEWTVDKAATPTEDGIMSRHCKLCDAVTDTFTFTYKEVEDSQNPDDDDTSSDENSSSDNISSDGTSSDDSSNDEVSSKEENTPSDTISSSGSSSGNGSPNKVPINNTVGSKNPQSAIEDVKDFIENVKPNLENNNTSSVIENTDSKIETSSNNSTPSADTDTSITNDTDTDNEKDGLSATQIFIIIIGAVLSVAIVVLAIILIMRRKKAE